MCGCLQQQEGWDCLSSGGSQTPADCSGTNSYINEADCDLSVTYPDVCTNSEKVYITQQTLIC